MSESIAVTGSAHVATDDGLGDNRPHLVSSSAAEACVMALSGDEERILLEIERHLDQEDPRFAHRIAAAQRHMRLLRLLPPYRVWLILVITGIVAFLAVVATSTDLNTDPLVRPSEQASADQRDFPVLEPR